MSTFERRLFGAMYRSFECMEQIAAILIAGIAVAATITDGWKAGLICLTVAAFFWAHSYLWRLMRRWFGPKEGATK